MRKLVKSLFPKRMVILYKRLKKQKNLVQFFWYDFIRFSKYSASIKGDYENRATLIAAITMDYHRIEKGLTMLQPREKFGLWFIPTLIDNVIRYKLSFGNHAMLLAAFSALKNYMEFHADRGVSIPELESRYARLSEVLREVGEVQESVRRIKLSDLKRSIANSNFKNLALARHSIRSFRPTLVSDKIICDAVEIASKSPSVCNRQAWRVYYITGEKLDQLLPLQNGNLGFRNEIKNLAIVTGKVSYMRHSTERNQVYIDGGLFCMSLMYALLSMEIGSCPLNWCVAPSTDKRLRSIIDIAPDEEVIMYLALGYFADYSLVAASPRNAASEIITFIH